MLESIFKVRHFIFTLILFVSCLAQTKNIPCESTQEKWTNEFAIF